MGPCLGGEQNPRGVGDATRLVYFSAAVVGIADSCFLSARRKFGFRFEGDPKSGGSGGERGDGVLVWRGGRRGGENMRRAG